MLLPSRTVLLLSTVLSLSVSAKTIYVADNTQQLQVENSIDQQKLDNLIYVLSAAMHAWNPSYDTRSIETALYAQVAKFGVTPGLSVPLIALMDMSYVVDRPRFAEALNPIIRELSPELADNLNKTLGLPTNFVNPFSDVARAPHRDLEDGFISTLGLFKSPTTPSQLPPTDNPGRYIDQVLMGQGSIFHHVKAGGAVFESATSRVNPFGIPSYKNAVDNIPNSQRDFGNYPYGEHPNQNNNTNAPRFFDPTRGGINSTPGMPVDGGRNSGRNSDPSQNSAPNRGPYDPTRGGINSTPGMPKESHGQQGRPSDPGRDASPNRGPRKGPFSNRDITSYNTCAGECAGTAGEMGALYGGIGFAAGTRLPHPLAPIIAGAIGGVIGAGVGVYDCAHSPLCGGGTKEPSQPKEDKDKVKNGKNYNDFFKPSTNLKEQDKGSFKVPDKLTPVVNPGIRYFGQ